MARQLRTDWVHRVRQLAVGTRLGQLHHFAYSVSLILLLLWANHIS